jgi:hypothetical protein
VNQNLDFDISWDYVIFTEGQKYNERYENVHINIQVFLLKLFETLIPNVMKLTKSKFKTGLQATLGFPILIPSSM